MHDFPLENFNTLAVTFYIAIIVRVDWIKRYKVCVLNRKNQWEVGSKASCH